MGWDMTQLPTSEQKQQQKVHPGDNVCRSKRRRRNKHT